MRFFKNTKFALEIIHSIVFFEGLPFLNVKSYHLTYQSIQGFTRNWNKNTKSPKINIFWNNLIKFDKNRYTFLLPTQRPVIWYSFCNDPIMLPRVARTLCGYNSTQSRKVPQRVSECAEFWHAQWFSFCPFVHALPTVCSLNGGQL